MHSSLIIMERNDLILLSFFTFWKKLGSYFCSFPCLLQLKEVPELQKELEGTKMALEAANKDKERLLQEIRKHDPLFQL